MNTVADMADDVAAEVATVDVAAIMQNEVAAMKVRDWVVNQDIACVQ